MLVFNNVTKRYHYEQFDTVASFNLTLTDKLNTLLIDAQSGKTTLCKLILGLEKPTAGTVVFDGQDCSQIDGKQLDATYLCKDLLLFENKTALYNVAYPLVLRGMQKDVANAIATQALEGVGINPSEKVKKLNEQDKLWVVLARLFARKSKLVLVDDFLPLLTDEQKAKLMHYFDQTDCFVVHFTSQVDLAFGKVYLCHDGQVYTENINEKLKELIWLNSY